MACNWRALDMALTASLAGAGGLTGADVEGLDGSADGVVLADDGGAGWAVADTAAPAQSMIPKAAITCEFILGSAA